MGTSSKREAASQPEPTAEAFRQRREKRKTDYPRWLLDAVGCIQTVDFTPRNKAVSDLTVKVLEPVLMTHRALCEATRLDDLLAGLVGVRGCDMDFGYGPEGTEGAVAIDLHDRARAALARFLVGVMAEDATGLHYEDARLGIAILLHEDMREEFAWRRCATKEPEEESRNKVLSGHFEDSSCLTKREDVSKEDANTILTAVAFRCRDRTPHEVLYSFPDAYEIEPTERQYGPVHIEDLPGPDLPLTTHAAAEYAWEAVGAETVTDVLERLLKGEFFDASTNRPFVMAVRKALCPQSKPRQAKKWSGPTISASTASLRLEYTDGPALTEFLRGVERGHWLYELRSKGPARAPNGLMYESAVNWVVEHRLELED